MLSNVVLGCGCGLGGEISGKGDIFQRRGVAGKHQGLMCNRFGVRFGRLGTEVVGITGASSTRRWRTAALRRAGEAGGRACTWTGEVRLDVGNSFRGLVEAAVGRRGSSAWRVEVTAMAAAGRLRREQRG